MSSVRKHGSENPHRYAQTFMTDVLNAPVEWKGNNNINIIGLEEDHEFLIIESNCSQIFQQKLLVSSPYLMGILCNHLKDAFQIILHMIGGGDRILH